jgi:hypothetical protein
MKDDTLKPAYNLQVSAENGFAVGYSIHQARSDTKTFPDHFNVLPIIPENMVGDSAYGSEDNYKVLEDNDVESFLKYPSFTRETKGKLHPFAKEHFDHDEKRDCLVCPMGETLAFKGLKHEGTKVLKTYQAFNCCFCSARPICCSSTKCRTVRRSEQLERLKRKARDNLQSALGVELRKRRGNESEGVFGILKHAKNFRRLSLRGISKATTEPGIMLLGMNLKKIAIAQAG